MQFPALCKQYIERNISHQKLRNCCVAKKFMSHTYSVKFRIFRGEFLRKHSVYWAQPFRDYWNCYALSVFRAFILLASSDSDKHMLMRQKTVNKDSPILFHWRGSLPADYWGSFVTLLGSYWATALTMCESSLLFCICNCAQYRHIFLRYRLKWRQDGQNIFSYAPLDSVFFFLPC